MASPRTTSDSQDLTTAGAAVFARHYLLERAVETATATAVWRATDRRDHQPFALKFFPPELIRTPTDLLTVRDLIVPVRQLAHPHVVAALEVATDHDFSAVVTPWIDAPTLVTLRMQQAQHCFAVSDIESWMQTMVDVLAASHAQGIVHGALTPHVVFARKDTGLVVTGFGINAWLRLASRTIFGPAKNDSRVPYTSPAVRNGLAPQPVDDVYAFGAIVYELITGEVPRGPSAFRKHRHAVPMEEARRKKKRFGTPIPPTWESLVQACLEPDASRRLASFAEIRGRLGFIAPEPMVAVATTSRIEATVAPEYAETPLEIAESDATVSSPDSAPTPTGSPDTANELVVPPDVDATTEANPTQDATKVATVTDPSVPGPLQETPPSPDTFDSPKSTVTESPVAETRDEIAANDTAAVEIPAARVLDDVDTPAAESAPLDILASATPALEQICPTVESVAPATNEESAQSSVDPTGAISEMTSSPVDTEPPEPAVDAPTLEDDPPVLGAAPETVAAEESVVADGPAAGTPPVKPPAEGDAPVSEDEGPAPVAATPPDTFASAATASEEFVSAAESVAPATDEPPSETPVESAVAVSDTTPSPIGTEPEVLAVTVSSAEDEVAARGKSDAAPEIIAVEESTNSGETIAGAWTTNGSVEAAEDVASLQGDAVPPELPESVVIPPEEDSSTIESTSPAENDPPSDLSLEQLVVDPEEAPTPASASADAPRADAIPFDETMVDTATKSPVDDAIAATLPPAATAPPESTTDVDEIDADLDTDEDEALAAAEDGAMLPAIWEDDALTADTLDPPEAPLLDETVAGLATDDFVSPAPDLAPGIESEPVSNAATESEEAEVKSTEPAASTVESAEETSVTPEAVAPANATHDSASETEIASEANVVPADPPSGQATPDEIADDSADEHPMEEAAFDPDPASESSKVDVASDESLPTDTGIDLPDIESPLAPGPDVESAASDDHPAPDEVPATVVADVPADAAPPKETTAADPATEEVGEPVAIEDNEEAPVDTTPPFIPTFSERVESPAASEVDEWRPQEPTANPAPTAEPLPTEATASAETMDEPAAADEPAPARTHVPMEPLLPRRGPLRHVPTPADQPRVLFPRSSYYERNDDALGPRLVRRALIFVVVLALAGGGWWGWQTYQRRQEYVELWRDVELFPVDAAEARREAMETRLEESRSRLSETQWRSLMEAWKNQPGNRGRQPSSDSPNNP